MSNYLTLALKKYVNYMRQQGLSLKTIKSYCWYVEKLAEIDSRIYRLSNSQIQDFILQYESGSTQNVIINALQKFFEVNHPDKRISVFVRPKLPKKLIEVLSQKEVWQIIDSISHVKQKAIIAGLYLHGLRRSEILNLYYHNIDRERRLLIIREGKGKKDRFAPLNTIWTDYLSKYAKQMNHKKGYDKPIFYPYSASSISNIIKQKASKLGIKKRVYPHLLRDCFATHLSQQSVGNKFIQEILGHSRVTTTQKYIHLAAEDISKIALKRIA